MLRNQIASTKMADMTKWGRFVGEGDDYFIPFFRRIAKNKALLLEDFSFEQVDGVIWTARKGLVFDGASIPKLLWGFSTNPWADDVIGPATIHDFYCKLGREGISPYSSSDVHYTFHQSMRSIGVSAWRARARWSGVKTFGPHFSAHLDKEPSENVGEVVLRRDILDDLGYDV